MKYNQASETFNRVRPLHSACGSSDRSSEQCHQATRGRGTQAIRDESESPRSEAETKAESRQAFRLGPRFKRPALGQLFGRLAGHFIPRQALSDNLTDGQIKA